ncbi:MAG: hypothetical protein HY232_13590 [Acidobacteria bacterium]|nr:hypothetical protein [Acidobacteriota bacterium]
MSLIRNGSLKTLLITLGSLTVIFSISHEALALPAPLFEFKFDQDSLTLNGAKDTGSVGRDQRMVTNIDTWAAGDPRTSGGLGVSGQATDRAYDSRNASSMGSAIDGSGVLIYPVDTQAPEIDQLASFTVSGWYRTENAPLGGSARLFKLQNGAAGFDAQITSQLNLEVGGATGGGSSTLRSVGPTPTDVNRWVFWAITYDGTKTTNNAIGYIGYLGSPVVAVGTNTIDQGIVSTVGANYGGFNVTRAVDGLLDNLRIFGSKIDGSGALSLPDLEAYRSADIGLSTRPLLEFKFDQDGFDTNHLAKDTGLVGRDQLMTIDNATWAAGDARTVGGLGVSGQPTDRALSSTNAASTGAADGGTGIVMYPVSSRCPEIDQLQSFTLCGWYKTVDTALCCSARLFKMPPAIEAEEVSTFNVLVKGVAQDPLSANFGQTPTNVNEWVFWAITYDGSQTVSNANAYVGFVGSPVTLLGTDSLPEGTVDTAAASYAGWNLSRGIKGYLDNLRIFGSKSDSSGVLSLANLEAYRAADVIGPAVLQITHSGTNIVVSWVRDGTLQAADQVTGPWSNVATTSPYTVPDNSASQKFYRLYPLIQ